MAVKTILAGLNKWFFQAPRIYVRRHQLFNSVRASFQVVAGTTWFMISRDTKRARFVGQCLGQLLVDLIWKPNDLLARARHFARIQFMSTPPSKMGVDAAVTYAWVGFH